MVVASGEYTGSPNYVYSDRGNGQHLQGQTSKILRHSACKYEALSNQVAPQGLSGFFRLSWRKYVF
jgi:hypothetical protein